MPNKYRIFSIIIIISSIFCILGGCQEAENNIMPPDSAFPDTIKDTESSFSYPMKTDTVLTVWSPNYYTHSDYTDYSESPFHSGLSANTGVKIEWLHPYDSDVKYSLNVLFSSGDMPDIIIYELDNPEYYIDANYIYSLNDKLEEYAPNLSSFLKENPDIDKAVKTDNGHYYYFPFIRDMKISTFRGLVIREDWLKEQNLAVPSTVSEFDSMLRTFYHKYNAVFSSNPAWMKDVLIGAYGIINGYYIDDNGLIQHGLAQRAYYDYLSQMHTWYKEGILDPNFITMDSGSLVSMAVNNKIGAAISTCGILSGWIDAAKAAGNEYNWLPIKNLVLKKGDPIEFSQMESSVTSYGAYITTNCKDIETAMRFLDWGYSKEGILFWNFGTEGESYEMIDGNPVFTPPANETISSWAARYTGIRWGAPSYSLKTTFDQVNNPIAVEAADVWSSDTNMASHLLPNLTATKEEALELSSTETLILEYMDDMYYRFIIGQTSLAEFDTYLNTLESMGLKRVLEIKQDQLQRYNSR